LRRFGVSAAFLSPQGRKGLPLIRASEAFRLVVAVVFLFKDRLEPILSFC